MVVNEKGCMKLSKWNANELIIVILKFGTLLNINEMESNVEIYFTTMESHVLIGLKPSLNLCTLYDK